MKLTVSRVGLVKVQTEANLSHNDEELKWDIKLIDRTNIPDSLDIFEQINAYWATLSQEKQDRIFDVYKRIRTLFDDVWINADLTKPLTALVTELCDHHSLVDIRQWFDMKSDLVLPPRLDDEFVEDLQATRRIEKTYLKEDYRWLVVLSIAIRSMIPVWGQFVYRTEEDNGTMWKEYYAYLLLMKTQLMRSEPMNRLRTYVEQTIPADKTTSTAVLGGISSEDYPTWILALVIVRRLAVGDVRGIDPNVNLITFIHRYIGTKVKSQENAFMVKEKIIDGQGQDSEGNLSRLEGVKVRQAIPDGDIAIIEHYAGNLENIARHMAPDFDFSILEVTKQGVLHLQNIQIHPVQIQLVQMVLKKVISPRAIDYLTKKTLLGLVAVTAALLWHRGHYDIAALAFARQQTNTNSHRMLGVEGRAKISNELRQQLDELYPYIRRNNSKSAEKQKNVAVISIELLEDKISKTMWKLKLSKEWSSKLSHNNTNQTFVVPFEIKTKLAQLIIALANRSF